MITDKAVPTRIPEPNIVSKRSLFWKISIDKLLSKINKIYKINKYKIDDWFTSENEKTNGIVPAK